jgi:hypothetical protein
MVLSDYSASSGITSCLPMVGGSLRVLRFFRNNQLLAHGWFSPGTLASSGITSYLSMVGGSLRVLRLLQE